MRYFVTGATGFIGGELVRQLLAAGHQVNALVRNLEKAQALADMGVQLFQGDITDKASLQAPMQAVDGVFHLAAYYEYGISRAQMYAVNVEGTRNVLEMMQTLQIPKGVYTSSLAVFGDTKGVLADEQYVHPESAGFISLYDETKWHAHYSVALPLIKAGLPLVMVQPGAVFGPDDTSSLGESLRQYLKGELPVVPAETQFSWALVSDVARGHILAMERGQVGESYIICGETHKLSDFYDISEEITGVPAPKTRLSPAVMRFFADFVALLERLGLGRFLPSVYQSEGLRAVAGTTYIGNNAKAVQVLGYQPLDFKAGLALTLKHEIQKFKS